MLKRWMTVAILVALSLGLVAWQAQGDPDVRFDQAGVCDQTPSSSTAASDVQGYVNQCLTVSDQMKAALNAATQAAFGENRLSPEETLDMLKKLENSQATQSQKEQVLIIFSSTLNARVPADPLIDEINEGIQFRVPFDEIVANVRNFAQTLVEVKELLDVKRIDGEKYAQTHVDTAIIEIAKALEDYIANSNNPNSDVRDSQAVYDFVAGRLNNLITTTLTQQIVNDIKSNVSGAELSAIALDACVRREKCTA